MARTFVPPVGKPRRFFSLKKILDVIHEQLEIAQGDYDKAGDLNDWAYYEGWVDALKWVELLLTRKKAA